MKKVKWYLWIVAGAIVMFLVSRYTDKGDPLFDQDGKIIKRDDGTIVREKDKDAHLFAGKK